jgi:hypothetical protein
MHARDQIEIVEAAYAIAEPHQMWQRRLTELVAGQWDGEAGSLVFDASDPDDLVRESVMLVGSEDKRALLEMALSVPVPAAAVPMLYHTGPHLTSLRDRPGPRHLHQHRR